jgi:hypothetical protein
MSIDELRECIWEHLFHTKATKSVAEIAALTNCAVEAVREAVKHEWFTFLEDRVSISYSKSA